MKRLLPILLVLVMILGIAACAQKAPSTDASAPAASPSASPAATESAKPSADKVLRVGMAGHFSLNIKESSDLLKVATDFTGKLLAASLHAEKSLCDCNLRGKLAFVIGNEGAGLTPKLLVSIQQTFIIPMPGQLDSLNAAAATAICLFEAVRQRR